MENPVIHSLQSASHEYWGSLRLKNFVQLNTYPIHWKVVILYGRWWNVCSWNAPPENCSRDAEDVIRWGVSGKFDGLLDNIHAVSTGAAPCLEASETVLIDFDTQNELNGSLSSKRLPSGIIHKPPPRLVPIGNLNHHHGDSVRLLLYEFGICWAGQWGPVAWKRGRDSCGLWRFPPTYNLEH